jgi:hypothetical protein
MPAARGRLAGLLAAVLAVAAPAHITAASVSVPAGWLILAAEVTAAAALARLAVRVICRFRSSPWPRAVLAGGTR